MLERMPARVTSTANHLKFPEQKEPNRIFVLQIYLPLVKARNYFMQGLYGIADAFSRYKIEASLVKVSWCFSHLNSTPLAILRALSKSCATQLLTTMQKTDAGLNYLCFVFLLYGHNPPRSCITFFCSEFFCLYKMTGVLS